ncbi:MAG: CU044_5270 family protein [Actinobacteria bacterium]|nr:CU044_5270 family protein [Actinomycetota bacterium]
MTERDDNLNRELRWLDPVEPGELERASGSPAAQALLERIVDSAPEMAPAPTPVTRRRLPTLALAAAGVAAVAAAVLVLILGLAGSRDGGDEHGLAAALDRAAATAASRSQATGAPYTYLKTREVSVSATAADRRSWEVLQSTTREEWVTHDGAGRLRIVDDPARFVGSGDRAEWEGAGEPTFLALGFSRRTEDRFLDAGMLRGSVAELPTDPAALAARLRARAEVEPGELSPAAATLQLIAEDLRDPGASPAFREALFAAAERVPGISYLGEKADPAGRRGVAVGVPATAAGAPALYSMIFDPGTSRVLATEMTSRAPAGRPGSRLLRARVYLEARGTGSLTGNGGAWLSGFDPTAAADPERSNLVYRIPDLGNS